MVRQATIALAITMSVCFGARGVALAQAPLRPDQVEFRELYRELVETNTTLSEGDCTLASRRMADRLLAAGYPAEDVRVLAPAEFPKSGSLVATLRGDDPAAPAIGLMAHIDVVEASAADWGRDPFVLQEADGYFSARGVMDDKAQAAMWVDSLIRLKRDGFRPRRDLRILLTCGEETPAHFNGVRWLMAEHPDVFDVAYIVNEGARGRLDGQKRRVSLEVQLGEKTYQDYTLETTNVGGHSSRPLKDNAITRLAHGLSRLGAHDFPVELNAATRAHFTGMAEMTPDHADAMRRLVAGETPDLEAAARLSADPAWNSMLRTTCVATQVAAGHAPNALPQRARANVNCRILPGHSAEEVRQDLIRVLDDPAIKVEFAATPDPDGVTPPLNEDILAPIRDIAARMWPGVPVIPTMATGATDGRFTNAAGIPTYGITGVFTDPDGGNNHGVNERIPVRSLYEARDFLHELIQVYAMGG